MHLPSEFEESSFEHAFEKLVVHIVEVDKAKADVPFMHLLGLLPDNLLNLLSHVRVEVQFTV